MTRSLVLAAGLWSLGVAGSAPASSLAERARSEPRVVFQEAIEDFKAGRGDGGIRAFQALAAEYRVASLEFDLGNAFHRSGDLGRAVLHWERALELEPWAEDVLHNLEAVSGTSHWGDGMMGAAARVYRGIPAETLGRMALAWLSLAVLGFAWARLGRARLAGWGALACLVCALSTGGWYFAREQRWLVGRRAVVLGAERVQASAGPGPVSDYPRVFDAHPGQVVVVHRRSGSWVQVALPTGAAGWVPRERIEEI